VQNTPFSINKTLNIRGRLVSLDSPRIMGILNVTPDSFYDGGRLTTEAAILERAERMLAEGATFLDVGGYSSRPGAADIPEAEELARVVPAVRAIHRVFPQAIISIDTFRAPVARAAVAEGAGMINDISGGGLDGDMPRVVAEAGVPYVLMHMRGTPQTMKEQVHYDDLLKALNDYFHERIRLFLDAGCKDIILDPGLGFAKTREHNFELLHKLPLLHIHGRPLLVGLSRKSMVWKTLGIEAKDALNGTTAMNTVALLQGASILRVHDVREAQEVITLLSALNKEKRTS
jgi:dihydropteroate synthase